MIRLLVAALMMLAVTVTTPASADSGPESPGRVVTSLNSGWLFRRDEQRGAEAPGFDDREWADVTLPHTFNGADGDDGGGYYRGPGWYRRTLDVATMPEGRRVWMQFDGAALATDLYVNGRHIGRHEGGHARFRFDVTDALKPGKNLIAVRVDNTKLPAIAPLGGDFTVFGGLYRHVSLVETGDVHVDLSDHGGPGVYVTTRALDDSAARIDARVLLRNDGARAAPADVSVTVRDATGRAVATAARRVTLRGGANGTETLALDIAQPRRWNGRADPYLYSVVTDVRVGGRLADSQTVPLGLRTTEVDAKRGFLLNGKPYPLHGVNMFHSGRPGRGLAVTDEEIATDMQILDELGVTGVRLVHFQHPPAAYEEADRRGFVIWTEIGLNGAIDNGPAFEANVKQQMRELIRQTRNHPSIALWGIGNEVYAVTPEVTRVLKAAHETARAEDSSRPTIYAHCCQSDDNPKAEVTDVIAFNRYFGWYTGQEGTIGSWADGYRAANPNRAFAVGEYGAGASIRHQQSPPPREIVTVSGWHPEQTQTQYHENNWRELAARPFIFGKFIWVAFDLASDGRREGDRHGINDKGVISYDRAVRKDAYYFYQAHWSAKPMVHIVDRRLDRRSEAEIEVRAFTNQPGAILSVNGQPVGQATATDRVARWPRVPLQPGMNVLTVTAGGVTDTVRWTRGAPSSLGVTAIPEVRRPEPEPKTPPAAPPGQ